MSFLSLNSLLTPHPSIFFYFSTQEFHILYPKLLLMLPFSVRILQNSVAGILQLLPCFIKSKLSSFKLHRVRYHSDTWWLILCLFPQNSRKLGLDPARYAFRSFFFFFGSRARELIPLVSSKVFLTLLSHMQLLKTGTPFQTFENPFTIGWCPGRQHCNFILPSLEIRR